MPAKGIFALGVGHVRRKSIEPGEKSEEPAKMIPVGITKLSADGVGGSSRTEAGIHAR